MARKVQYMQGGGGRLLYDPKHRFSPVFIRHVFAEQGKNVEWETIFDVQPAFFQLPTNLVDFDLTQTTTDSISLLSLDSLGQKHEEKFLFKIWHYRTQSILGYDTVQIAGIKCGTEWQVVSMKKD